MVLVPAATPVVTPVAATTVALGSVLLLHVPPAVADASVVVRPTHTAAVPVIAAGSAFTVSVVALKQLALTI
jgi:hypothetical protein